MKDIYFISRHKTGVVLLKKIREEIKKICPKYNLYSIRSAYKDRDIPKNDQSAKIIHIYRNPYEVIASSYKYHKKGTEQWLNEKNEILRGMTYYEYLNVLSQDNGIYFEMSNNISNHSAFKTIMEMYLLNSFNDDRALNIFYEDFYDDFEDTLITVLEYINFDSNDKNKILNACSKHNIFKRNDKRNMKHVTNHKKEKYDYPYLLSDFHYKKFTEIYPKDLMKKLRYE